MFRRLATAALLSIALASSSFAGEAKYRLAIHVDQNDAQVMNLALNNATNVIDITEPRTRTRISTSSPTVPGCICRAPTPRP